MKIAYQKYPLVGNYTHPWVLLTIIISNTLVITLFPRSLGVRSLLTFTSTDIAQVIHHISSCFNILKHIIITSFCCNITEAATITRNGRLPRGQSRLYCLAILIE